MSKVRPVLLCVFGLTLVWVFAPLPACTLEMVNNLTKERTGDITVVFVNNTPYAAAFSFGTYDAWDRSPPGQMDFQQVRVEANTTNAAVTLQCARNAAVASTGLVQRATALNQPAETDFVPEQFDSTVHFSEAPSGSAIANLPTAGSALGVEKLLGVDYSCGDQLIFTFNEDPDAEGGFRIDFENVLDARQGPTPS
jgi:hypothetical protein